jgi:hypothetical protein
MLALARQLEAAMPCPTAGGFAYGDDPCPQEGRLSVSLACRFVVAKALAHEGGVGHSMISIALPGMSSR